MPENIDLDLSGVLERELLEVLSGKRTTSELLGETEITVSRTGLNL